MKKIFIALAMSLVMVLGFANLSFAAETKPIELIEITELDSPYSKGEVLDTKVVISSDSRSYFEELTWTKTSEGLHKATIRMRAFYYEYHYDENTKVTINGVPAHEVKIDEDNKYYINCSYIFSAEEVSSNMPTSSTLYHVINVMYMNHGTISPNPIRAPHGKNFTVQIIPDEGYQVKDVKVDGESVGAVTEYTFKKVKETHKIKAFFEPIEGYVPSEDVEIEESGDMEIIESGDVEVIEPTTKVYEFDDVNEKDWFYDEVQYVCNEKLFNGVSETMFAPEEVTTREQLVSVLYRYAINNGTDVSVGEDTNILSYDDATEISEYAVAAFQWACGSGIINGTTETTLAPQETLTREQLVTILYRYAKLIEMDTSAGENTNILSYDDAFEISEYAIAPFQWACAEGVIKGKTETTLAPQDFVIRAELATMMMRFNQIG